MTAKELWHIFCCEMKIDENTPYEAWSFGGAANAGDELLKLVLQGRKFGTASAYDEYVAEDALEELPKIGDYSVLLWASGEAACVIKNYDVYLAVVEDGRILSSDYIVNNGEWETYCSEYEYKDKAFEVIDSWIE